MSVIEITITNPKKQLEFYKQLCEQLQQENQQLKEQLKLKKQELKGFTNAIAEYLGFDEPEHTIYDEIFDKINQLKIKLQQRKEVIEKTIWHLDCFISDENLSKYDTLKILMHAKSILNKYEKEES